MSLSTPLPGVQYDRGGRRGMIVESLLAEIFQGGLRAGQHLVTQELAARFGTSHTPIREALIALAGIGVVDQLPNRGALVRRVTARDVREIMQVRRALECEAVRSACGRIDLAELHAVATELKRLASSKAPVRPRFIDQARLVDSRLHDLIASSCGNTFLANELNRLKTLFRAFRDVSYTQHEARNDFRRLAEEAKEHLAIVDALLANDRAAAVRAMSRHLRGGVKYWSRALPEAAENQPPIPPPGRRGATADRSAPRCTPESP
ncbi:MAG: GntR family transcriptional regulator [Planctomycetales bacterium]